jgi:hypothetical protein
MLVASVVDCGFCQKKVTLHPGFPGLLTTGVLPVTHANKPCRPDLQDPKVSATRRLNTSLVPSTHTIRRGPGAGASPLRPCAAGSTARAN